MFEKEGMKKLLILVISASVVSVVSIFSLIATSNNNITLESYGDLDSQASIMIIILDFENDTRSNEIIDANVYEKQRRNEILRQRIRPHLKDNILSRAPIPSIPLSNPISEIVMKEIQDHHHFITSDIFDVAFRKFCYTSKLNQSINLL